ncbi:MAG: DUF1294 domain-containing protein [Neofamilia sp.]
MIYYFLGINLITFLLFAYDKRAAKKRTWRIKEIYLSGSAFLGGSFGAYLGMHIFKHKTKKPKFTILILAFIIIHIFLIYKFMT